MGFFFYLAQDPTVRAASLSTGPVYWTEHQQWYTRQLDTNGFLFVGQMDGGEPVGTFRSDIQGVVSVAVAPRYRGRGLGKELITQGSRMISALLDRDLTAYIRPSNQGSQEVFSRAGYRFDGKVVVQETPVLKYRYRKIA